MPSNPPALPARLTRPDAQAVVDALNLRLHEAEQGLKGPAGGDLAGNYPNPTLATGAKQLFPQLATPGAHKINFGSTAEIKAGETITVNHSLGVTPVCIHLTPLTASANEPVVPEAPSGTTSFKIKNTGGLPIFCYWLAIG